jgi:uncharacterized membrane protein YphA (DoxX/SURF4 family)
LVIQGTICATGHGVGLEVWFGVIELVSGALLAVGLFTPIASVVGLLVAGLALFVSATCKPDLFDAKPSMLFGGVILLSLLLIGPGAFSVDARAFGRREIIIPPISRSRSQK